jgi:hypothetical protein
MSSNKNTGKVLKNQNSSIVEALRNNNLLKKFLLMNFRNSDALSSSSTSRRDFLSTLVLVLLQLP